MESSTSKTGINTLIIISILLIGASLATVFIKKPTAAEAVKTTPTTIVQQPVVEEVIVATTTASTTETVATSTNTVASTTVSIKGFTEKNWTWVKTTNNSKVTTPKKATAFTITFNTDGSIKGTTDCNSFFGNYAVASTTLSFGPLGATQMFCDGAQEGEFMLALQEITSYIVDKNNNLILNLKTSSSSMMFK